MVLLQSRSVRRGVRFQGFHHDHSRAPFLRDAREARISSRLLRLDGSEHTRILGRKQRAICACVVQRRWRTGGVGPSLRSRRLWRSFYVGSGAAGAVRAGGSAAPHSRHGSLAVPRCRSRRLTPSERWPMGTESAFLVDTGTPLGV